VLATSSTTAAHKLSAAATAVSKLTGPQLAEGVADLTGSPEDAPDALLSLVTGNERGATGGGGRGGDGKAKQTQCLALMETGAPLLMFGMPCVRPGGGAGDRSVGWLRVWLTWQARQRRGGANSGTRGQGGVPVGSGGLCLAIVQAVWMGVLASRNVFMRNNQVCL
jgi:hypothetical protein